MDLSNYKITLASNADVTLGNVTTANVIFGDVTITQTPDYYNGGNGLSVGSVVTNNLVVSANANIGGQFNFGNGSLVINSVETMTMPAGLVFGDVMTPHIASISRSSSNVVVEASGNNYTFGNDGKFQLPPGGDIVDSNGSSVLITPSGVSFPLTRDNYNSPNMLQATEGDSNWNIGFYSDGMDQFYTQVGFYGLGSNTRGFRILDNDSGNSWVFDGTGNLRLPNGGGIGPAGMGWPGFYSDNGYLSIQGKSNNPDYAGQLESEIFLSTNNDAGYVNISLYDLPGEKYNTWQFTPDGNLSMPGNTVVSTPDNTGLRLRSSGSSYGATSIEYLNDIEGPQPYNSKVIVRESGAQIHTSGDLNVWQFDGGGNLVLPYNGKIKALDITNEIVIAALTDSGPQKSGIWFGKDNNEGTQQYVQVIAADSDGRHAEINAWADGPDYNAVEIKADIKSWEFKSDGNIRFPDNTIQTTAYNYSPQPLVNLDGGIASTQYPTNYVYVDGGGSYVRGILQEDTFDGSDNAAGLTEFDKVLNGGGA